MKMGKLEGVCRRGVPGLIIGICLFFACAPAAQAHEKWFFTGMEPVLHISGFFTPFCQTATALAVTITIIGGVLWHGRGKKDLVPGPEVLGATDESMVRFYSWVPLILGIHFAVPLMVLGVQGDLFSANNQLPLPWNLFMGLAEIGFALSFLYGGLTRLAGLGLGLLWLVGVFVVGIEPALENLIFLGAAVFFFCTGRGPYAIDRLLFPALEPSPALAVQAMKALRISVGLGFAFVAFSEKLANPELATAFLDQHHLNFTSALGFALPDRAFIWCAGATELIIGLFLAFGFFPRVIILVAWGIINLTLTIFSWVELVGHLPIYGVMAVLLIWTPSEKSGRLWVRGVLGPDS
jgi:uncharacterized membrane protein YphA (DoxX/SURF4 family)